MSRFTEHFDIYFDQTNVHSPVLLSPSKASFSSTSTCSSKCVTELVHTMDGRSLLSNNSQENNSNLSVPLEEKPNTKLKRFFTTISRKKRNIA